MLALLLVTATRVAQATAPATDATDAEILRMLETRVEAQRQATGIVVGIVDPKGKRIIRYGTMGVDDRRPVGGDTVFDIGSITKVFTALLLSDIVERAEVALDDPVTRMLPAEELAFLGRGGRLFMQQPGQDRIPLFAYGEREFFLKIVDAQITFELAGGGPATVATWHQSGQTAQGLRIE